MRQLTKIRLINWHYFANETIVVNGSTLFSGENSSGKSTILDAVKLVLTTSERKFNQAANENGKRDLKGYVRCKTGSEESTYLRKGSVIAFVALEFFDDKKNENFVIGVKCDSTDENSRVNTKWFFIEDTLDTITFIKDRKPVEDKDFKYKDTKIQTISQKEDSKNRIRRRLGNFQDKFFTLIPKALAFKPMNDIKQFINDFVLQEEFVDIEKLQENLNAIKRFEKLLTDAKKKLSAIDKIIESAEKVAEKDNEIIISEFFVARIEIAELTNKITGIKNDLRKSELILHQKENELKLLNEDISNLEERISDINVQMSTNSNFIRIGKIEIELKNLNEKLSGLNEKWSRFSEHKMALINVANFSSEYSFLKEDIKNIFDKKIEDGVRQNKLQNVHDFIDTESQKITAKKISAESQNKQYEKDLSDLEEQILSLKKKKFTYPTNTVELKKAIEEEFSKRNISSEVKVFCELLEMNDESWRNAVEGYLNTQKFYLFIEPKYFDIAASVYQLLRKEVHSARIVDLNKLNDDAKMDANSLAEKVVCKNADAKKYVAYLLGRVICCDDVIELKKYNVSMTKDCMLYKNYSMGRINPETYSNPFIGADAFIIQLRNCEKKSEEIKEIIESNISIINDCGAFLNLAKSINWNLFEENILLNKRIVSINEEIIQFNGELKNLKSDPNIIELSITKESLESDKKEKDDYKTNLNQKIGEIKKNISYNKNNINENQELLTEKTVKYEKDKLNYSSLIAKVEERFKRIDKDYSTAKNNQLARKNGLYSQRNNLNAELVKFQSDFNNVFQEDYYCGYEFIDKFYELKDKLEKSTIIDYEDKISEAKATTEQEFRVSFLAELKANIEEARAYFKELNVALKNVPFGDEYYSFEVTPSTSKSAFYEMIMDNDNMAGLTLFRDNYDSKYKDQMDDLFNKLTVDDQKVVEEYTDYRRYLDYDIKVVKGDKTMRLSKVMLEKSGGETQTAFYVVIAASFNQIYAIKDSIKLIMFDEAFNQMSPDRIESMFDFFNSMNFQIVLATPPEKMECIGEKVKTINYVQRNGNSAIVLPYLEA